MISLIQDFEADFLWKSQPQNPEFKNNPENFRQRISVKLFESALHPGQYFSFMSCHFWELKRGNKNYF